MDSEKIKGDIYIEADNSRRHHQGVGVAQFVDLFLEGIKSWQTYSQLRVGIPLDYSHDSHSSGKRECL